MPEGSQWVQTDEKIKGDTRLHCADLSDLSYPWRHDSEKLARTLIEILDEHTGPLT